MLESIDLSPKALDDYRDVVGADAIDEIRRLAEPLSGSRVLHINATAYGGGVAEILTTLVPLMRDLGLDAEWQVVRGGDEFYNVTKAIHNSLQGMEIDWSPEMDETWLHHTGRNADAFDETYDFVVAHDPQPAGIRTLLKQRNAPGAGGKWVWRCHIDLTDAQTETWNRLRPYVSDFDGAIFTAADYVKEMDGPQVFIVPPAIDPLSPKNVDLSEETYRNVLAHYHVAHDQPFIAQISRFDPWKDPLGVVEAYRIVKQQIPELQLVMIASMAHDDPEGWEWYERIVRRAGEDFDIHVLSNLHGVGNVEVNAFQRADVVIQKSLREGFGLVVSEALWKQRPVVAGRVGGIPMQLVEGETGYLVDNVEECADRVLELLRDPAKARRMGAAGREYVRERFLITRYLRDYLQIFRTLRGLEPAPPSLLARAE